MNRFLITLCLALVAIAAGAQTQNISDALRHQEKGQGKVVVNQSDEIERLVSNPRHHGGSTTTTSTQAEDKAENTAPAKTPVAATGKVTCYRIQVYSGGNTRADHTKCEQIAAQMKTEFPNLPIYVKFFEPSWKCRIGNFTDKAKAEAVLSKVRSKGYREACLVQGKIYIKK